MNQEMQPRPWADRWLNNGANIITLSRIPMTAAIIVLVYKTCFATEDGLRAQLFLALAIAQTIGMVTDGIDGWYARKFGGGGTPEGQFLDQFVDKIFVWSIWIAVTLVLTAKAELLLFQMPSILLWSGMSIWLLYRDIVSCKKHWSNYLKDRDKPFNAKSGAINWGKRKFFFENMALCAILLTLIPAQEFHAWKSVEKGVSWVATHVTVLAFGSLLTAIICAEISVRKRGAIKSREQRLEDKLRPKGFAEAVVDPDERL